MPYSRGAYETNENEIEWREAPWTTGRMWKGDKMSSFLMKKATPELMNYA